MLQVPGGAGTAPGLGGVGAAGVELHHALPGGDRAIVLPLPGEGGALVVQRARVPGVEAEHPGKGLERLGGIARANDALLLDVRTPDEFAGGHIPGAVNLPIDTLRDRLATLDRGKPIVAYCQVGQRGYLATRILGQAGFDVANLSGGYATFCQYGVP